MIRELQKADINKVTDIWLDTNVTAHSFISSQYWQNNFELVKELLLQATVYVYEQNQEIQGFIGLNDEYIEFLKRTDLGSQYPKERFEERIAKLVDHVSISLVARNKDNQIVGVLFGLTDYAYWLYITDLGVDRDYLHQGIGELIKTAHSLAGGKNDIAVYLVANENAIAFYEKLGMKKANDVMEYNHIEWTHFTVK